MMASYKVGAKVSWSWGSGKAHGKVIERFERRVQRTLKGSRIVRIGSVDDPALLIEQSDGARVLKLASEVDRG